MDSLIEFVPRLRINLSTSQEQAVGLPLVLTEWAMSNIPAFGARSGQSAPRIDVHHHYFPLDLKKEKTNVDVGWKTPPENLPWCPKISLKAMDAMKVDFAILSYPAISSGFISEGNRTTARRRNELAAGFCRDQPDRFGFFATLPFLDDVEGQDYLLVNPFL
jgi:predicted TIM-barrel fold metal-dependent hydrolase